METTKLVHNGVECSNKSVSTGDDYPEWWLQLSTNIILSDRITAHGEDKVQTVSVASPTILDQSVQTDEEIDKRRTSSPARSPDLISRPSSSINLDNYDHPLIDRVDNENNSKDLLSSSDNQQKVI